MTETEFNQEFGGSFLGASFTLINTQKLESLNFEEPIKGTLLHEKMLDFSTFLSVYQLPKKGNTYSMSVDSAKMVENSVSDAICMQVIDITKIPYTQVCTFYAPHGLSYMQAPEIAYQIGVFYNTAYAFVENNEIGQLVVDSLAIDYEYENVFYEKPALAGYRTTTKTKRLGCSNLKAFIEHDKLQLADFTTVSQLSTFIRDKNSFKAEFGYQDDAVMALMGCLFFLQRNEFDDIDDKTRFFKMLFDRQATSEAIDEDVPAFGLTYDDMDNEDKNSVF